MHRIHPCLWFDTQAEEAARFYVSIFKHSKVGRITHYGDAAAKASGRPKGSVMTVEFELDGQPMMALNGGPAFKPSQATSLVVNCGDQKEVDAYWSALSQGGQELPCSWVKDKYGYAWQIVPVALMEMHADEDPKKRERVMAAMLKMKKIDLAEIERAYEGK